MEIDPANAAMVERRVSEPRDADSVDLLRHYYRFTEDLDRIWPSSSAPWREVTAQMTLME